MGFKFAKKVNMEESAKRKFNIAMSSNQFDVLGDYSANEGGVPIALMAIDKQTGKLNIFVHLDKKKAVSQVLEIQQWLKDNADMLNKMGLTDYRMVGDFNLKLEKPSVIKELTDGARKGGFIHESMKLERTTQGWKKRKDGGQNNKVGLLNNAAEDGVLLGEIKSEYAPVPEGHEIPVVTQAPPVYAPKHDDGTVHFEDVQVLGEASMDHLPVDVKDGEFKCTVVNLAETGEMNANLKEGVTLEAAIKANDKLYDAYHCSVLKAIQEHEGENKTDKLKAIEEFYKTDPVLTHKVGDALDEWTTENKTEVDQVFERTVEIFLDNEEAVLEGLVAARNIGTLEEVRAQIQRVPAKWNAMKADDPEGKVLTKYGYLASKFFPCLFFKASGPRNPKPYNDAFGTQKEIGLDTFGDGFVGRYNGGRELSLQKRAELMKDHWAKEDHPVVTVEALASTQEELLNRSGLAAKGWTVVNSGTQEVVAKYAFGAKILEARSNLSLAKLKVKDVEAKQQAVSGYNSATQSGDKDAIKAAEKKLKTLGLKTTKLPKPEAMKKELEDANSEVNSLSAILEQVSKLDNKASSNAQSNQPKHPAMHNDTTPVIQATENSNAEKWAFIEKLQAMERKCQSQIDKLTARIEKYDEIQSGSAKNNRAGVERDQTQLKRSAVESIKSAIEIAIRNPEQKTAEEIANHVSKAVEANQATIARGTHMKSGVRSSAKRFFSSPKFGMNLRFGQKIEKDVESLKTLASKVPNNNSSVIERRPSPK